MVSSKDHLEFPENMNQKHITNVNGYEYNVISHKPGC